MDLTIFGYHLELGSQFHFSGNGLDVQFSLILALFVIVPLITMLKTKYQQRAEDDDFWPTFGSVEQHGYRATYMSASRKLGRFSTRKRVIVVIDLAGMIVDEYQGTLGKFSALTGNVTFGLELGNVLKSLATNGRPSAILLRVNTPGGTVPGSQYIYDGIKACVAANIPVVCYVQNLAASGGVWAMVGADTIIAHPSALIGSIGVIGPSLKRYKSVTQMGSLIGEQVQASEITSKTLYAGKGKNLGDPFAEPDDESVRSLQEVLESTYDKFVAHVAESRSIAPEKLRELGAAVMSSSAAMRLGLIDSIGDQSFAQETIAERIGVAWKECKLLWINKPVQKTNLLFGLLPVRSWEQPATNEERAVHIALSHCPLLALWNLARI